MQGLGGLGFDAEPIDRQKDGFGVLWGQLLNFGQARLYTGGRYGELDLEVMDERFCFEYFHFIYFLWDCFGYYY